VNNTATDKLLKQVSRSFYLSLRLLPAPMRGPAALAYLLARASDTLADSATAPAAMRIDCLDRFSACLNQGDPPQWPDPIISGLDNPHEKLLLLSTTALIRNLRQSMAAEARLIRNVVEIIISGQRLDIERFGQAGPDRPVSLPDAATLDDYTWRVAGCVGEFWTRLGHLTLGSSFSDHPIEPLIDHAVHYGRGLQLVNILRDLPTDLSHGRSYLPVADPSDHARLLREHARWLARARELVTHGFTYAACLKTRRLRTASVLPAMIARDTLNLLEAAGPAVLCQRVKIPRSAVYRSLMRAIAGRPMVQASVF
jgi:farnesyl-diphosphate farnesyltransferase